MSDQLRDQLKKYKKKHGIKTPTPKKRKRKKKAENFSHDDIEELVGIYRSTYKKGRGGAYKQN